MKCSTKMMRSPEQEASFYLFNRRVKESDLSKEAMDLLLTLYPNDEELQVLRRNLSYVMELYNSNYMVKELLVHYYLNRNFFKRKYVTIEYNSPVFEELRTYNIFPTSNEVFGEIKDDLPTVLELKKFKHVIILDRSFFSSEHTEDLDNEEYMQEMISKYYEEVRKNGLLQLSETKFMVKMPNFHIYTFVHTSPEETFFYEGVIKRCHSEVSNKLAEQVQLSVSQGVEIFISESDENLSLLNPITYIQVSENSKENIKSMIQYFNDPAKPINDIFVNKVIDIGVFTRIFSFLYDTTQGNIQEKIKEFEKRVDEEGILDLNNKAKAENKSLVLLWAVNNAEIQGQSYRLVQDSEFTILLQQCIYFLALLKLKFDIDVYFINYNAVFEKYQTLVKNILNPLSMLTIEEQINVLKKFPQAFFVTVNDFFSYFMAYDAKKREVNPFVFKLQGYIVKKDDYRKFSHYSENEQLYINIDDIKIKSLDDAQIDRCTTKESIEKVNLGIEEKVNSKRGALFELFKTLEEITDIKMLLTVFNTFEVEIKNETYYMIVEEFDFFARGILISSDTSLAQLDTFTINKQYFYNAISIEEMQGLENNFVNNVKKKLPSIRQNLRTDLNLNMGEYNPMYYSIAKYLSKSMRDFFRRESFYRIDSISENIYPIREENYKNDFLPITIKNLRLSNNLTIYGFIGNTISIESKMFS